MSLVPQAKVSDVVSEFSFVSGMAAGTGPFTLMNVANVSSGQIYDRITEANAFLQQAVGLGGSTPPNAWQVECVKRFEVAYASAHLASNLIGVVITDGFNVTTGGIAIQRQTAQQQGYVQFIKDHLNNAMEWRKMLHPWFFVNVPTNPQGSDEYGNPVGYWSVSPPRY
jgi:hypothetical protein